MKQHTSLLVSAAAVAAFFFPALAFAATSPGLGAAATYGALGSTYTNTTATTINGDLGYTTPPAVAATVNGTTHVADTSFNQAGIDQGTLLGDLNAQTCDFNFGSATDLSLLSQPLTPGVYCVTGAMSLGTAGITLGSAGTYIFRSDGALTSVANSIVTLTGGASACDVFWTPTEATTLGANSTFAGSDIDASGITIGSTVTWVGRVLAFGGTVTTDTDTITVPDCTPTPPPTSATLHVIKVVVGGTVLASDFSIKVKKNGYNVAGSPAAGAAAPGTLYTLAAGTYVVSENPNASYTQSFSGDCSATGSVTLALGNDKTCTITNTIKNIPGSISGTKFEDQNGDGILFENECGTGLQGWTIYLDSNNNGALDIGEASTITDKNGAYRFASLAAGTYQVREVGKSGWVQTYPAGGVQSVTLAAGQNIKKKDFGNFKFGVISGLKYNDANGNGKKDTGEVGLAGWTITLKGPGSNGPTVSVVTDASGTYSFAGLTAGTYTLAEVMQTGWRQTQKPGVLKVSSATNATKNNFGNTERPPSSHRY